MKPNIRVEQYEQAAEQSVSIGGIRWLTKYDVKIQFADRDTAYAWKAKLEKQLQGEPPMRVLGYVRKEMLDLCKVANNAAALTVVPNPPKSGNWVAIYVDKEKP